MSEVEEECCHLCLNTERHLSSLEGVLDVYLLLVGSDPDRDLCVEDVRGCWECLALLRRVATFRRQARWVRDVLDTADELLLDKEWCLSKLKCDYVLNLNIRPTPKQLSIERRIISTDIQPKPITRQESSQNSQDREVSGTQDGSINNTDTLELPIKEEQDETTYTNYISHTEPAVSYKYEPNIKEEIYDCSTFFQTQYANRLNETLLVFPETQLKTNVTQQSEDYQEPDTMKQNIVIVKKKHNPQVKSTDMTKSVSVHVKQDNDSSVDILKSRESSPRSFDHLGEIPDSESEPTIAQTRSKSDTKTPSNTAQLNVKETLQKNVILAPQHHSQFSNINMTASVENRNSKLQRSIECNINKHIIKNPPRSLLKNLILTIRKDSKLQSSQDPINKNTQSVLSRSVTPRIESNGSETVKTRTVENTLSKQQEIFRSPVKILTDSKTSNKEEIEINSKQFDESFHSNLRFNDLTILNIPVTRSQLNDFLEQARNSKKYLASPFKCKFCIVGFNKESSLKEHMDVYNHVLDRKCKFTCDICHRGMPNQKTLDAHQSTHRFLYSCVAEDFVSVSPQIVLRHYVRMHGEKKPKSTEQNVQNTLLYEIFTPSEEDLKNMAKALNFTPSNYSCNDCCRHYSSKQLFLIHRELHSEEAGALACEYCKMRFPTEDKLANHRPIHESWYRCKADPTCQYIAPTYHVYYSHWKEHDNTYERAKTFEESKQARIDKTLNIMNSRCEKFKPTVADMETLRGLLSYLSVENHCELCCDQFTTDQELREHGKLHEKAAGAHACKMCKLRFTSEPLLAEHKRVHEQWYRCKADPGCLHITKTFQQMQKHLTEKHRKRQPIVMKLFQCDICAKVFFKRAAMVKHIMTHDKCHMCEVCGRFYQASILMTHKRNKHTDEAPKYIICDFCPKRFDNFSSFRYHRNMHLNIKPYACKECPKMFSSPPHRNSHYNTVHLKKKPKLVSLTCSVCRKNFPNTRALCNHMQTHRDLRKFKCEKCPKSFVSFNNLIDHQVAHTEEKNHQCHMCYKKFTFLSNMNIHIQQIHKKTKKKNLQNNVRASRDHSWCVPSAANSSSQ